MSLVGSRQLGTLLARGRAARHNAIGGSAEGVSDERGVFDDSWERDDSSTSGARDELTGIASSVRRARADERARLSRLLHDQLGQTLTGLKMDLHWVGVQLPAG